MQTFLFVYIAEDYDDFRDIALENILPSGIILKDDLQRQVRRHGKGRDLVDRPIGAHFGRRRSDILAALYDRHNSPLSHRDLRD